MNTTPYTIKKLTADHLDQYNELLRYAFQVTENELLETGWGDDEIKQSKFPVLERANVWGCFDGDTLISQFAAYPLEMNIHSALYPIAFITSVSTYPEYSGMGLMSKLMKQSLTEMRECGQSLALLYPYSIPLYRKKGWEIVSDKMSFHIRDVQLPKHLSVPGYVRRVPWESSDFMNLHTRFARQTHGCLFRNNLAWDEYWRWDEDDTTVAIYYKADDTPSGYMVYLIKDDVMNIKEMIYLDCESRKGLWKYIGAHDSMINEVVGCHYFSEPIAFSLEDSDIKETIRPYIMGRIVDIPLFLKQYHFHPGTNALLTLHISDPFLEWNHKQFTLEITDGHPVLKQAVPLPDTAFDSSDMPEEHSGNTSVSGQVPSFHASMSIGTLTTLLLGYKQASQLCDLERIQADAETIHFLDYAVIYKKPYISDYI